MPSEEQITRLTKAIGAETEMFRAFATSTPAVDIVSICLADLIFIDFIKKPQLLTSPNLGILNKLLDVLIFLL